KLVDEFLGDAALGDVVLEFDLVPVHGLDFNDGNRILARSSGLLDVPRLDAGRLGKRLAISNPGLPRGDLDAELIANPVRDHFQVELTHSGNDGLPRLGVARSPE